MAGTSVFNADDAPVLYRSALADFSHDFSDPGRSDVTLNTLNGIPIEYAKTPNRNYGALNGMIDAAKAAALAAGKGESTPAQAYWIFRNEFQLTVPRPGGGVPNVNAPPNEPDIVAAARIPYDAIMSQLTRDRIMAAAGAPIEHGTVPLGFNTKHNYSIRSLPAKGGATVYDIPTVLSTLIAAGQTTFVLMWDAGNISITRLHEALEGATGGPYTFYFIRSKENISDPAPKITAESMRSSPNVNVYFLEDNLDHVSTYPIYVNGSTNNENLFSAFTLETKLNEDGQTVSGTIKVALRPEAGQEVRETTMSVKDIGKQSEVKQAVVTAVHMKLNNEPPETIMPYFFLKRAGDWCQALCLLDRTRKYRVIPTAGAPPPRGQVTIDELESAGAYVAMITIDRIMLAYLIGAGLNVFYTTVRPGATWVTSFQNIDAGRTDDGLALMTEYGNGTLKARAAKIKGIYDTVVAGLRQTLDGLPAGFGPRTPAFAGTIIWIRQLYIHLATLPSPAQVAAAFNAARTAHRAISAWRDGMDARILIDAVAKLRNAIAAINAMRKTASPVVPPSSGKDAKSEEAFTVVVDKIQNQQAVDRHDAGINAFYSFVDDISTASKKLFGLPLQLNPLTFVQNERDPVFPVTRSQPVSLAAGSLLVQRWKTEFAAAARGGNRMKGGSKKQSRNELYSVYAYEPSDPKDVTIAQMISDVGGATAALGSSILLPSGFLATVASDFLFEEGDEDMITRYEEPYQSVYRNILEYDKLRMKVHRLQSAHALDTVAQQELFELDTAMIGARFPNVDEFVAAKYPSVDALGADLYEREANATFLGRLLGMEQVIRNAVNAQLDTIRMLYRDANWTLGQGNSLDTHLETGLKRVDIARSAYPDTAFDPYNDIIRGIDEQRKLEAAGAETRKRGVAAVAPSRLFSFADQSSAPATPIVNAVAAPKGFDFSGPSAPVGRPDFPEPAAAGSGAAPKGAFNFGGLAPAVAAPRGPFNFGGPGYTSYVGGGLQPRRSLYTKHVGGSAPAPRRGLYAGLR